MTVSYKERSKNLTTHISNNPIDGQCQHLSTLSIHQHLSLLILRRVVFTKTKHQKAYRKSWQNIASGEQIPTLAVSVGNPQITSVAIVTSGTLATGSIRQQL